MSKLTKEQREMTDACIELGAAWTTSVGCENDQMLSGWVDLGWAERVAPPAKLHSLSSYVITPAGIAALSNRGEHHD